MIKVNAMGDACPIPVVKTKNAIRDLNGDSVVETLVDNEIAVQNLTKMANQKGYGVESEQLSENEFKVTMYVGTTADGKNAAGNAAETDVDGDNKAEQTASDSEVCVTCPNQKRNTVVVISSNQMGVGDDALKAGSYELGKTLLKGFIYALSQQDELPTTILFYNSGASITCEDSASLEDLKEMQAAGVEILTCGTCLNFYGLTDKLKVGEVTNMYVIAEKMSQADLIIKP